MTAPILVIGQSGQLARALARRAADVITVPRSGLDLSAEPHSVLTKLDRLIEQHQPRGVINAAAYTQVDQAETDNDLAFRINADAPAIIAQRCALHDIPFVHISTDYVFDGRQSRPWREADPVKPLNVYGHSKLAGEKAILNADGRAAVLRTSWVYDLQGQNFVTTMLRLAKSRSELRIVDDQIGRPTHADVLAAAALASIGHTGLFHVSGCGEPVSWAGFAAEVFDLMNWDISITPVPSSEYPTAAMRPAYSVLDTSKFETEIMRLPDWRDTLRDALTQTG